MVPHATKRIGINRQFYFIAGVFFNTTESFTTGTTGPASRRAGVSTSRE